MLSEYKHFSGYEHADVVGLKNSNNSTFVSLNFVKKKTMTSPTIPTLNGSSKTSENQEEATNTVPVSASVTESSGKKSDGRGSGLLCLLPRPGIAL